MIKLKEIHKGIFGDVEILLNVAEYIRQNVGRQDWANHVEDISGYMAAGIGWERNEVVGFMNVTLFGKVK